MQIKKALFRALSSKGILAVFIGRLYFVWFWIKNHFSGSPIADGSGPVVSLTTYSKRVQTVYLTLESIGRGSLRPSAVFLWLDESELIQNLPPTLKRLVARGLQVMPCKNYGPHKKYYPYVAGTAVFPSPLVTADDDVFYARHWLRGLHDAFLIHPEAINCYKARVIRMKGTQMAKYAEWRHCETDELSFRHFATGVSGVIYPPLFLKALKAAEERFLTCCPRADDIWLHVQALRSGYRVRQLRSRSVNFPSIPGSQDEGLYHENIRNGGNDAQISATYQQADLKLLVESGEA